MSEGTSPGAGRKLLVVDDDPVICDLLTDYLGSKGFEVSEAHDVDQALRLLESGASYDIMLVDKNLPGRNGIELVREVHRSAPEVVMIVITGVPSRDSVRDALQAGASGYIIKPFGTLSELLDSIEECSERHRRWFQNRDGPGGGQA